MNVLFAQPVVHHITKMGLILRDVVLTSGEEGSGQVTELMLMLEQETEDASKPINSFTQTRALQHTFYARPAIYQPTLWCVTHPSSPDLPERPFPSPEKNHFFGHTLNAPQCNEERKTTSSLPPTPRDP